MSGTVPLWSKFGEAREARTAIPAEISQRRNRLQVKGTGQGAASEVWVGVKRRERERENKVLLHLHFRH